MSTLQMASPKTGERNTSMKRAQTPAFCIYSNVRQTETLARIESYYGSLSLYLPEGTAQMVARKSTTSANMATQIIKNLQLV